MSGQPVREPIETNAITEMVAILKDKIAYTQLPLVHFTALTTKQLSMNSTHGHTKFIHFVQIVGGQIFTADLFSAKVWDVETGKLLHDLPVSDAIYHLSVTSSGTVLFVSKGSGLYVWDWKAGRVSTIHTQKLDNIASAVMANPQIIGLFLNEGMLELWDMKVDKCVAHFKGYDSAVVHGNKIVAVGNGKLGLVDLENFVEVSTSFPKEPTYASIVVFNEKIVVLTRNTALTCYDFPTLTKLYTGTFLSLFIFSPFFPALHFQPFPPSSSSQIPNSLPHVHFQVGKLGARTWSVMRKCW